MTDRVAFISANSKCFLPEFAYALHDKGFTIVSLGETAKAIEAESIPVVQSRECVRAVGYEPWRFENVPEKTRRGIVAGYLCQLMEMPKAQLSEYRWPHIDLVYINLIPPQPAVGPDNVPGIRTDASGAQMISSAINGQRTVLVSPEQLPYYTRRLEAGTDSIGKKYTDRELAIDALRYLRDYTENASELSRSISL